VSLLTLIRENAILANIEKAGDAYKFLTEAIHHDAKSGACYGEYSVADYPQEQRLAALKAIKLQGFNALFKDESNAHIWVSWMPKHPR
jgi:hypothetical protein